MTRDHLHGHGHQPKCDKGGWSLEACTCLTARLQLNREFDYVSPVTLKEALIEDKSKIGLAIHFVFNTYTAVEATRYSTQIIWRARGVALELCGGYIPNIQSTSGYSEMLDLVINDIPALLYCLLRCGGRCYSPRPLIRNTQRYNWEASGGRIRLRCSHRGG